MTSLYRQIVAATLVLIALGLWATSSPEMSPAPPQPPSGSLVLKPLFYGPTAYEDSVILSSLTAEIADKIEQDGLRDNPRLKTGAAFDDLRVAAREARLGGQSIGNRQPKVRDAISRYLEDTVGVFGGEVTAEMRAKWVSAFRDISNAAK